MRRMSRDFFQARSDFPGLERTIGGRPMAFFDGAAGTQVPRAVIDAVSRYYETSNANTGGLFATTIETDEMIEQTRAYVAALLGAPSPRTISFGQNMTTLAFMLSHAFAKMFLPGDEVVITALDHEANRGPWLALERAGVIVREVGMRPDGHLEYDDFERLINPRTRLVAVGMASNALGTVNDIRRIVPYVRAAGARLLLDAVHFAPHLSTDVVAVDADFLLCSAYKFYGPHVGILYSREGLLDELETDRLSTASQTAPGRIETGTLNHAAIAGVHAAIEYIATFGEGEGLRERLVSAMNSIAGHERSLARRYFEGLASIAGAEVHGPDFSGEMRAPTVSITLRGRRAEEVAGELAAEGIAVWNGNFYARRAVELLGLEGRGGMVRSGFFLYNTDDEVDRLLTSVEKIAAAATAPRS
jgi:cysteine desulfurase family protein (TIGR01976 family)